MARPKTQPIGGDDPITVWLRQTGHTERWLSATAGIPVAAVRRARLGQNISGAHLRRLRQATGLSLPARADQGVAAAQRALAALRGYAEGMAAQCHQTSAVLAEIEMRLE